MAFPRTYLNDVHAVRTKEGPGIHSITPLSLQEEAASLSLVVSFTSSQCTNLCPTINWELNPEQVSHSERPGRGDRDMDKYMVRWKLNGEFRMQLSIISTVCGGVFI